MDDQVMGAAVEGLRTREEQPRDGAGALLLSFWLWDVLFAVATVLTCGLIAIEDRPWDARLGAIAVVLAIGAAWPLAGRRMTLAADEFRVTPGRLAFCVAIGAGLVAGVALADSANWAAFVVYSLLFWLLPLPWAIGAIVLLTVLTPLGAALFRGGSVVAGLLAPQALFMTVFGVLVGIFITRLAHESERRAELITELEASRTELAALSEVAGATAERERLAGEIHDTLAQGFTSIVTLLQAAQAQFEADPAAASRHVELAVRSARENLQDARRLVVATAPVDLVDRSLPDAVGRAADRLAEETGLRVEHGASGAPRKVPPETGIVLLRAAQELLANVRRHASAGAVAVRLDFTDPDAVTLAVTDDGTGFDPGRVGEASFGLRMMRTRAERLDGSVAITSGVSGTTVAVTLPTALAPQEVR
jgi:signal transduction histidine kinase